MISVNKNTSAMLEDIALTKLFRPIRSQKEALTMQTDLDLLNDSRLGIR